MTKHFELYYYLQFKMSLYAESWVSVKKRIVEWLALGVFSSDMNCFMRFHRQWRPLCDSLATLSLPYHWSSPTWFIIHQHTGHDKALCRITKAKSLLNSQERSIVLPLNISSIFIKDIEKLYVSAILLYNSSSEIGLSINCEFISDRKVIYFVNIIARDKNYWKKCLT